MTVLEVHNFAHVDRARIEFGDLTVLVGPQATGKSLILQWLKVALDAGEIVSALRDAGHDVKDARNLIDLIFGQGMASGWRDGSTEVSWNGHPITPSHWTKGLRRKLQGKVFYIPAHRALLLAEGWPAPFVRLNADTPVVARLFSQTLYQRFSGRKVESLFPRERLLKNEYRRVIDNAVFHGGQVELEKTESRYRLALTFQDGDAHLPFMTWTAGQREFTPLLLGLYHVLPERGETNRLEVKWVVIEEPEMGLHPQAIVVVMLLVLELLARGYKVAISTHSPLVLDIIWAIQRMKDHRADWQTLCDAFSVPRSANMMKVMKHALTREYRVYSMELTGDPARVTSRDISGLDPFSEIDAEANWGGLTGFSSRFGEAVRRAVNEAEFR